jgi:hypothetical protein
MKQIIQIINLRVANETDKYLYLSAVSGALALLVSASLHLDEVSGRGWLACWLVVACAAGSAPQNIKFIRGYYFVYCHPISQEDDKTRSCLYGVYRVVSI